MRLFVAGVLLSVVCVTGMLLAAYTGQAGWLILSIMCGYIVWMS
jgi:hypothetical protein